jgi:hypothetical protein
MEMNLFTVLTTTGEKFSICLHLAHSRVGTYRNDEAKAREYASF